MYAVISSSLEVENLKGSSIMTLSLILSILGCSLNLVIMTLLHIIGDGGGGGGGGEVDLSQIFLGKNPPHHHHTP